MLRQLQERLDAARQPGKRPHPGKTSPNPSVAKKPSLFDQLGHEGLVAAGSNRPRHLLP
jgi:hypothetical protein